MGAVTCSIVNPKFSMAIQNWALRNCSIAECSSARNLEQEVDQMSKSEEKSTLLGIRWYFELF